MAVNHFELLLSEVFSVLPAGWVSIMCAERHRFPSSVL